MTLSQGMRIGASHMGLQILIKSERTPEYLEERIDTFLRKFVEILDTMEVDFFEGIKSGIMSELMEDFKSQSEEYENFNKEHSSIKLTACMCFS